MASVDYGGGILEGAVVVSYNGYGYNPECVVAVGYGGQGQGYTQQGFYNNQPLDLPSIPMVVKETSAKATTLTTMCPPTIQPVVIFLGLMGIGHTSKCHDPIPTHHIPPLNHYQTSLLVMTTFSPKWAPLLNKTKPFPKSIKL